MLKKRMKIKTSPFVDAGYVATKGETLDSDTAGEDNVSDKLSTVTLK